MVKYMQMIVIKNKKYRLPDAIIIGCQKAGTTALKFYLNQHPHIWMNKDEIHYFDIQQYRGDEWYLKHFTGKKEEVVMCKTPGYIYHEHAVKHLARLCPNTKLIVLLREPAARAYSEYKMLRLNGSEKRKFEDVVFRNGEVFERCDCIKRGAYVDQLKRLYQYFPKEQILVLKAEDLRENKQREVNKVTDFLEIPNFRVLDDSDKHLGGEVRWMWLNYITGFFANIRWENEKHYRFVTYICTKIVRWTKGINKKKGYKPMNQNTKEKLQKYYAEKNKELKEMVGITWDM